MKHGGLIAMQRQQGFTLIVALIFLILLGLLGTSITSNNLLHEKMAGNTRQRDLAFQAAERALQAADVALLNPSSTVRPYIDAAVNGTALPAQPNGLLLNGESHDNDLTYWRNTFNWATATNSIAATGIDASLVSGDPRYVIEQMPTAIYGAPATTKHFYRVTARGVAQASNTVVILQTMYKFE